MHTVILTSAVVWMVVLLAVAAVTVLRAETALTRVLALDTVSLFLVAVLILFAAREEASYYLDAALILALLSFISTVAAARYRAIGRIF